MQHFNIVTFKPKFYRNETTPQVPRATKNIISSMLGIFLNDESLMKNYCKTGVVLRPAQPCPAPPLPAPPSPAPANLPSR